MGNDLQVKTRELESYLQSQVGELAAACSEHITPQHALQALVVACYKTPDLIACDRNSLKVALIQSVTLGLDLNPTLGEAYLIPRWNKHIQAKEAQLQPGYRGLAKLARAAAGLNYIQAELVRKKDYFEAKRSPDWQIEHIPVWGNAGGPITHVYAVAKLPTGEFQLCVMTSEEVEEIRQKSDRPNAGPWVEQWGEMAKKTAVKRLVKLLPTSGGVKAVAALAQAVDLDNREYEDGVKEHHAINHDNGTGHGSGAYASPEDVRAYSEWLKGLTDELNAKWADRYADDPRGVPNEIMTTWQLSGHMLKWARSQGLVNSPEDVRAGQRDKFAAVAWVRNRDAFEQEARQYGRDKWADEAFKLKAALPREPGCDDSDGEPISFEEVADGK